MNESRTCANGGTNLTQVGSPPVRRYYELVGADGIVYSVKFEKAAHAAEQAKRLWPDQEQDPDRTGKGWDIQLIGVDG